MRIPQSSCRSGRCMMDSDENLKARSPPVIGDGGDDGDELAAVDYYDAAATDEDVDGEYDEAGGCGFESGLLPTFYFSPPAARKKRVRSGIFIPRVRRLATASRAGKKQINKSPGWERVVRGGGSIRRGGHEAVDTMTS